MHTDTVYSSAFNLVTFANSAQFPLKYIKSKSSLTGLTESVIDSVIVLLVLLVPVSRVYSLSRQVLCLLVC